MQRNGLALGKVSHYPNNHDLQAHSLRGGNRDVRSAFGLAAVHGFSWLANGGKITSCAVALILRIDILEVKST